MNALEPGTIVANKFRIERVIGEGGMGVVVAAHHLQLDEKVAIKFLLPKHATSVDLLARFVREAQASAKIKSEHVARVIDVGQLDDGAPYIVMEHLEGLDLAEWLERQGPLPIARAVDFVLQACEAIGQAHLLGIVHRDLKPANLFCVKTPDGRDSIKVLDFGISKFTARTASSPDLTKTHSVVGSPLYMSPEQLMSARTVDGRSDIWSLGVILFELVTGCLPFEAEAVTELAIKIANETPKGMRELRPEVPAGLQLVVDTCLDKKREGRFRDVAALAQDLAPFGSASARASADNLRRLFEATPSHGDTLEMKSPLTPREKVPAPGVTMATWSQERERERTRSPARRVVLVAGGVVLAGAAALIVTFGLRRPTAAPASPPTAALAAPEVRPAASPSMAVSVATPVVPDTVATGAASTAPKPPTVRPPAAPVAKPLPAPAPVAPKVDCNPPYTIDAKGTRTFKPECI